MKLLQINSAYKINSTGRTCYEVERALTANGFSCITACQFGFEKGNKNNYQINSWFEYYVHNFLGRVFGLCGYGSVFATLRLISHIKQYQPDVIHLRNLHGFYINLPILFRFLRKYNHPVFLNIHDCWIITGKCPHYTVNGCFKWKTQCSNCPKKVVHQYPSSYFFDCSKKMFNDKKRWLTSLSSLTVLGVSQWTAEQASMSFLNEKKISYIYNWVDLDVFNPNRLNVLSKYGLKENIFTVVFAAVSWTEGSGKLLLLQRTLQILCDHSIQFLIVGKCNINENDNIKCAGYISDAEELANIFSSCNAYVHLSLEDTFGKVVAESLACGTPAVVFNSTALPELVDSETGRVVPPNDINAIKEAVLEIMAMNKRIVSSKCRHRAENLFNYRKNVSRLLEYYAESINPDSNRG